MTDAPPRFPLAWPKGRPRTPAVRRLRGAFSTQVDGKSKLVNVETACNRVEDQVDRLGGVYAVLSSNLELRLDGRPRSDRAPPADPGVCLYFHLKGKPHAMACDTFDSVAQNIAALAAHIEAVRRIERYGVASAADTLQAFQALPPPPPGGSVMIGAPPDRPWHEVLGLSDQAEEAAVAAVFRALVKGVDQNSPRMRELISARDAALRAIRSRELCGNG